MSTLKRAIGLPSATALVVGTIIGSSIFVQASEITNLVPDSLAVIAAWAVAGVLTLIGALVCAELSSALPEDRRRLRLPQGDLFTLARLPVGLGDVVDDAQRHPRGDRDGVRALCRDSSCRSMT